MVDSMYGFQFLGSWSTSGQPCTGWPILMLAYLVQDSGLHYSILLVQFWHVHGDMVRTLLMFAGPVLWRVSDLVQSKPWLMSKYASWHGSFAGMHHIDHACIYSCSLGSPMHFWLDMLNVSWFPLHLNSGYVWWCRIVDLCVLSSLWWTCSWLLLPLDL